MKICNILLFEFIAKCLVDGWFYIRALETSNMSYLEPCI